MPRETSTSISGDRNKKITGVPGILWIAIVGLFAAYALQISSPLRLNPDAVVLLHLAGRLSDGQPFLLDGVRPLHPIGVPWLFSVMERAGVANSTGFAVLNVICLSIAGTATWFISRCFGQTLLQSSTVILVSFSSFVLFKHSVIPLSDIPYMTVSLASLAWMESTRQSTRSTQYLAIALSLLLATLSMMTRRVGIALLPAFMLMVWQLNQFADRKKRLPIRLTIVRWSLVAAVGICGAIACTVLIYVPDMKVQHAYMVPSSLVRTRFVEWGELLLNLPAGKLGTHENAVISAGIALLALMVSGMFRLNWRRPTVVYFSCYCAILAIWPFGDARFWIPCLPLMAMLVVSAVSRVWSFQLIRWTVAAYLLAYFTFAIIAAVYTTQLTFSGNRFLQIYGSTDTRRSYQQALSGQVGPENVRFAEVFNRFGTARDGVKR